MKMESQWVYMYIHRRQHTVEHNMSPFLYCTVCSIPQYIGPSFAVNYVKNLHTTVLHNCILSCMYIICCTANSIVHTVAHTVHMLHRL